MKFNDNGTVKDIYIKTFDTLPIGTEVDYDGETVPDGWSAVNNVLYNNASGSNGSIELSDSVNNYSYIEIYFSNASGTSQRMAMQKLDLSLSKKCMLFYASSDIGSGMYINSRDIVVNDKSLSTLDSTRYSSTVIITQAQQIKTTATNNIYINKVIGYK